MVFWNRLRQSQSQLKRYIILLQSPYSCLNQASLCTRLPTISSISSSSSFLHPTINLRFFAAPVQVKKKVEHDSKGPKLNESITAPLIRLVTDQGHDVLSRRDALERAKRLQLDLVEVDRNAKPPVCKLMDYNKERYKQQVKDKERAKSSKANLKKGTVKEIRFTGQITPNDIQLKADTTRRLLEEGYRVKCLVTRKKKEDDLGKCLSRLLSLIEDITMVDFGPNVEVDQAHFVLRHVKLGPPRRSGSKTSKVASPSSADSTQLETSGESEPVIAYENGSEPDDEEDTQKIQPSWGLSNSNNDEVVFDAEAGARRNARSNKEELATRPANRYSQPTNRRPPIDSAGVPASPLGTENRYRRDPRNYNAPVRPAMNNGSRVEATPTEQRRQPQFEVTRPHNREAQHSGFSDRKFPRQNSPGSSYGNFGGPSERSREQQNPAAGQASSSYGNFGGPSESSREQQNPAAGQANRYKKDSGGDQSRNSAAANSKYGRGGVVEKDGQGEFGASSSNRQM